MILTGAGGSCTAFDRIESGGLYAATYLYSPTMAGSAAVRPWRFGDVHRVGPVDDVDQVDSGVCAGAASRAM
jgi:hypothetical protein